MIDLESRLAELGDLLAIDDDDVADDVLAALGALPTRTRRATRLHVAAAALLVVSAVVAIVPPARDTVAGWLGLDRVEIDRRDDLVVPDSVPPITVPSGTAPATPASTSPIGERTIVVDGTAVLLGTIDGRLSDAFIGKTVAADAPVISLAIDGRPALWIEEPHEVIIERGGQPIVERIAGSTLLWQDGDVLWRVEGFATLDEAVAFARSR